MGFRKNELLVLERDAVLEHLHEFAALRIQTAITEVDNWRTRLFADDNARRSGHHLAKVITGEGGKLLRFHERGFLAGVDSRSFNWRQRGVWNRIDIETSRNDHGLGFSRFGDAGYGERPVFIRIRPRGIVRVYTAATLVPVTAAGFFILAVGVLAIDIVIVACGNRSRQGVLSQAGLNKTTERDPRQRHSQSKSNFRMHARDEKELFPAMQAFLLHFCNVHRSPDCYSSGVCHQEILPLDVERWGVEG